MREFNRPVRYLAYTLEILVLFMLQETPGLLPEVFGTRPYLVLPAVLTIAMLEEEIPAMAFGIFGGLFLDFGLSGMLGFHALVLSVLCFFVSIISRVYLQINLITAIVTGVWTTAVALVLGWLCYYYLPGYSSPDYALLHHYLPQYCYTLLFYPLLYFLNRGVSQAVRSPDEGR